MKVAITGIGLQSALGDLLSTWRAIAQGQTGIRIEQPFFDLQAYPLAMMGPSPAHLVPLTQSLVVRTLTDANLPLPLPELGVVVGSSRGQQRLLESWASQRPRPESTIDWFAALPHAAAVTTARVVGSTGPVLAPMSACTTGLWAIAQGAGLIERGECQQVIAGAVETPITPLGLTGFERMGALAKTGSYPFDRQREGLVLGEGGALFLLESLESARQRHAPIYGHILGFGFTADATFLTAPDPSAGGAIAAIHQCLNRSHLTPTSIDYIHAHGTGTRLNDAYEANLIQTLFPPSIPVSSTKGATGHTLGASGAFGIALSLLALQKQQLPPSVGLKEPEFPLNFVRCALPATLNFALCFGFGFGGQNGAIALARGEL